MITFKDGTKPGELIKYAAQLTLPNLNSDSIQQPFIPQQTLDTVDPNRTLGFPYNTPSATSKTADAELFQITITDAELEESFKRNPLSKVIINDVAEDVFDKGFIVQDLDARDLDLNLTDQEILMKDQDLTKTFLDFYEKHMRAPVIRTYKLARLHGFAVILIGYQDEATLSEEVLISEHQSPRIAYLQPIPKTWISEIMYAKEGGEGAYIFPISIVTYAMNEQIASEFIHPSRICHVENPSISVLLDGESALTACFDDLLVLKHVTWGAGQTMWRSGNQLLTAIAPPRASAPQIQSIDDALADIHARSSMTFPFGTEIQTHAPSGLNPAPYATIPLNNISAATRIPISILIGSQSGAKISSATDARDYTGTLSGIQNNVIIPILNKLFWAFQKSRQLEYTKFKIVFANPLSMSAMDESLVEYRQALTAKINNTLAQDVAKATAETNANQVQTEVPITSSFPSTAPAPVPTPLATPYSSETPSP